MNGLSQKEAEEKLKEFGLNEIPQNSPIPWWTILFAQFSNFVVLILIFSAIVSFLIRENIDGAFILVIVILNSLLGFYQEIKAQKDIRSLSKMLTLVSRVIRDGVEKLIPTKFLVPGDVVLVGAGDRVPADGILQSGVGLTVNEAILTGESASVFKSTGDSFYMASTVLSGHGKIEITKIGKDSRFGSIAISLKEITDEKTPLEKKIEGFGRSLGLVIIILGSAFFLLGIAQQRSLGTMFLQAVSLVVAVIPEGLPAIFTITMAIGVSRMARKKAIIRKLSASEGLGSVNVICTDKTGTLTKNEMTAKKIWLVDGTEYEVDGVGYSTAGEIRKQDDKLRKILEAGVLCNNSSLALKENSNMEFDVLGDTTEGSLLILAKKAGIDIDILRQEFQITEESSFNSEKMMMSVTLRSKIKDQKSKIKLIKGAPEKVVDICTLTQEEKDKILQKVDGMGREGLRVLGFAENKTFVGLVGIYDPPRAEVKETIRIAKKAGIRTVMLTGDNPQTALKIAREIGLIEENGEVVTGEQLEKYSGEILKEKLKNINVFARVTPLNKLKIVESYQKQGLSVGVTGDGINDAPALKKADIGIAMGITGTDVAKEAADIVITDDNFSTIVRAVEEGRVIYDNILKAIKYLISSNMGESLTMVIALVLGWPIPLVPQQILWINLVTDGLPALAMAVDPKDKMVMQKAPRDSRSGLLSLKDWRLLVVIGAIEAFITLIIFRLTNSTLMVFNTLVVLDLIVAFIIRGKHQSVWNNWALLLAVGAALLGQIVITLNPFLRLIFSS